MPMIERSLILIIVLHGCRAAVGDARPLSLEIRIEGDPGVPLSGVPVKVDGDLIGLSDGNGRLRTVLASLPGSVVRISLECPEGHRQSKEAKTLRIRRYEDRAPTAPLRVVLRCRPRLRIAAILVRTENQAGVSVLVDGDLAATTNDLGIAHVSRSVPPGTELLVELDASQRSRLRPRRTSRVINVADFDEVFVIDQQFEASRGRRKAMPPRRRIIKIE